MYKYYKVIYMKKNIYSLLLLILSFSFAFGQISVGGSAAPDPSSLIDVQGKVGAKAYGILFPNVKSTSDVTSTADGLIIYQDDATSSPRGFYFYTNAPSLFPSDLAGTIRTSPGWDEFSLLNKFIIYTIPDATVTSAKVRDTTVLSDRIALGILDSSFVKDSTIIAEDIADNSIGADKIDFGKKIEINNLDFSASMPTRQFEALGWSTSQNKWIILNAIGGLNYRGRWDATTNTPAISDTDAGIYTGYFYIVTNTGSQDLGSGSTNFNQGDWVFFDGASWINVPTGVPLSSYQNRIGDVVAENGDFKFSDIKSVAGAPPTRDSLDLGNIADIDVTSVLPAQNNVLLYDGLAGKFSPKVDIGGGAASQISRSGFVNEAITSDKVNANAVTTAKLLNDTIKSDQIANNTIDAVDIADAEILVEHFAKMPVATKDKSNAAYNSAQAKFLDRQPDPNQNGLIFFGAWSANINSPTLKHDDHTRGVPFGAFYSNITPGLTLAVVGMAGTSSSGRSQPNLTNINQGDFLIFTTEGWEILPLNSDISSFGPSVGASARRTGVVSSATGDYAWDSVSFPAGTASSSDLDAFASAFTDGRVMAWDASTSNWISTADIGTDASKIDGTSIKDSSLATSAFKNNTIILSNQFANASVTGASIDANTLDSTHLDADPSQQFVRAKIGVGSLQAVDFEDKAFGLTQVADNGIDSSVLGLNIRADAFAVGSVDSTSIDDDIVSSAALPTPSRVVATSKRFADTTVELSDFSSSTNFFVVNNMEDKGLEGISVSKNTINDGRIVAVSVDSTDIGDDELTEDPFATNSVEQDNVIDGTISTSVLRDRVSTVAATEDDAVEQIHVLNDAIVEDDLGAKSQTNVKLKSLIAESRMFQDQIELSLKGGAVSLTGKAVLELDAEDKGFILPKVSGLQINALESSLGENDKGLYVFNTTEQSLYRWEGQKWIRMTGEGSITSPYPADSSRVVANRDFFTYRNKTYGVVEFPAGGSLLWLDRNLDADDYAVSRDDASSFGGYFQWGRSFNGHQASTSSVGSTNTQYNGPLSEDNLVQFYLQTDGHWLEYGDTDTDLWTGYNTRQNPCPPGWRVTTEADFTATGLTTDGGAFNSPLRMSRSGFRADHNGLFNSIANSVWFHIADNRLAVVRMSPAGGSLLQTGFHFGGDGVAVRCVTDVNVANRVLSRGATQGTFDHKGITYGVIYDPATRRHWLDRNLGATASPTSWNDANTNAWGWQFQWGRRADGHQIRTSSTSSTVVGNISNTPDDFITNTSAGGAWYSASADFNTNFNNPNNHQVWNGDDGVNNPCPPGWRLPTVTEWNQVINRYATFQEAYDALKLNRVAFRNNTGAFDAGNVSAYATGERPWTNAAAENSYQRIEIANSNTASLTLQQVVGASNASSVRCISDEIQEPSITDTVSTFVAQAGEFIHHQGVIYQTIEDATNNLLWLDKNLGATRVAQSADDSFAYGHYLQWGRKYNGADGYGIPYSPTSSNQVTDYVELNDTETTNFIIGNNEWIDYSDPTLWNGINSPSNPCPPGWRPPTIAEFTNLGFGNANLAFNSAFRIPSSGYRQSGDGKFATALVGAEAFIWTTTSAQAFNYSSSTASTSTQNLAHGIPVRCVTPADTAARKLSSDPSLKKGDRIEYLGIYYNLVEDPATTRKWFDKNLGATKVPASVTDTDADALGWLVQWGRGLDGHQLTSSTSATIGAIAANAVVTDDVFRVVGQKWHADNATYLSTTYDAETDTLWNTKGTGYNEVCPPGWRVPTLAEWTAVASSYSFASDLFNTDLKIHRGSVRIQDGTTDATLAAYASSERTGATGTDIAASYTPQSNHNTTIGNDIKHLARVFYLYNDGTTGVGSMGDAFGMSIRCIDTGTSVSVVDSRVAVVGNGINYKGTTYSVVQDPNNANLLWLDQSLTSAGETEPNLFQWGRNYEDDHSKRTSTVTSADKQIPATEYIYNHNFTDEFYRQTSSNTGFLTYEDNTLWDGINSRMNPCPPGWRVPTAAEFTALGFTKLSDGQASDLALGATGARTSVGALGDQTEGHYWTSDYRNSYVITTSASSTSSSRPAGAGLAVRCVAPSNTSDRILSNEAEKGESFEYLGNTYTVVEDIKHGDTEARKWLDRNLGATSVPSSVTDQSVATNGWLFQWGRRVDGHQVSTSTTTNTVATNLVTTGNQFISGTNAVNTPWHSGSPTFINDNIWDGVDGINNPCPPGWRIPTRKDWQDLIDEYNSKTNGVYDSPMKIHRAGHRLTTGTVISSSSDPSNHYAIGGSDGRPSSGSDRLKQQNLLRLNNSNDLEFAGGSGGVWGDAIGTAVRCIDSIGRSKADSRIAVDGNFIEYKGVEYNVIPDPSGANIFWLDKSLTTSGQTLPNLFQWGRNFEDEHSKRSSSTSATQIAANSYIYDHTFTNNFYTHSSQNWLTYNDETLWNGINSRMNPCPPGWRLPTSDEFNALGFTTITDAQGSALAFERGGQRSGSDGSISDQNSKGIFWTSTLGTAYSYEGVATALTGQGISNGFAVRCVAPKDTAERYLSTEAEIGESFEYLGNVYSIVEDERYGAAEPRRWLDRNLGASEVPSSVTDVKATTNGWKFQWGRRVDGHQIAEPTASTTTTTVATNMVTTNANYVIGTNAASTGWHDILATFNNNRLWNGVDGINNPCPPGWQLPTETDWQNIINGYNVDNGYNLNSNGAYNSPMRFHRSGQRDLAGAVITSSTQWNNYAIAGPDARPTSGANRQRQIRTFRFNNSGNFEFPTATLVWGDAFGMAVRCIDSVETTFTTKDSRVAVKNDYIMYKGVSYKIVEDPNNSNLLWLDKALTSTGVLPNLFQWGRNYDDDHSVRNSTVANKVIAANEYIYDHVFTDEFYNNGSGSWLTYTDNTLWNGINSRMNPCPPGWRVATISEYSALGFSNLSDGQNSELNFGITGTRTSTGTIDDVTEGHYWAADHINSYVLTSSSSTTSTSNNQGEGMAVRCVAPANTTLRILSTVADKGDSFEWLGNTYNVIEDNAHPNKTARKWLDRNLGATRLQTSSTDNNANSRGWAFQWGRRVDGHQIRTSSTSATSASNMVTTGSAFSTTNWFQSSATFNGNRIWNGVDGINNPCPPGWRLPNEAELNDVATAYSTLTDLYNSPLKMHRHTHRYTDGTNSASEARAFYLSSELGTIANNARVIRLNGSNVDVFNGAINAGMSVRCIDSVGFVEADPRRAIKDDYFDYKGTRYFVKEDPNNANLLWLDKSLRSSGQTQPNLFQWGRNFEDEHSKRSSSTSNTQIAANVYIFDHTFTNNFYLHSSGNWLTYEDDQLWNGINSRMNPCPPGWRVATTAEFTALGYSNIGDAESSDLAFEKGGTRAGSTGSISDAGTVGSYWTSEGGTAVSFDASSVNTLTAQNRNNGHAVRCVSHADTTRRRISTEADLGESFEYLGLEYTIVEDVRYGAQEPRRWLDRNLGASQVPSSVTDQSAATNGWKFQWGRRVDGHQVAQPSASATSATQATNMVTTNSDFITSGATTTGWHSNTATFNGSRIWNGVDGINNPCPPGWQVPTMDDWNNVQNGYNPNRGYDINGNGAHNSPMVLHRAGFRSNIGTVVINTTTNQSVYAVAGSQARPSSGANADQQFIPKRIDASNNMSDNATLGAFGVAVRCIDNAATPIPTVDSRRAVKDEHILYKDISYKVIEDPNDATLLWLDKSLTSNATLPNLFQWGRNFEDNHSMRSSTVTSANKQIPANEYIYDHNFTDEFYLTSTNTGILTYEDNTLWNGINSRMNPCPPGWRVPTATEFTNLGFTNVGDGESSILNLGATGLRRENGNITDNNQAHMWTSAYRTSFAMSAAASSTPTTFVSGRGLAIRCITEADTNNRRLSRETYEPGQSFEYLGLRYNIVQETRFGSNEGRKWLDRNLGATEVPTSYTDERSQTNGWKVQWGRRIDGHQIAQPTASSTSSTQASNMVTTGSDFITATNAATGSWFTSSATFDGNRIWNGVDGINNPCPPGWQVPTEAEWNNIVGYDHGFDAYDSPLRIHKGGHRQTTGNYVSSTGGASIHASNTRPTGTNASFRYFDINPTTSRNSIGTWGTALGTHVRCIDSGATAITTTSSLTAGAGDFILFKGQSYEVVQDPNNANLLWMDKSLTSNGATPNLFQWGRDFEDDHSLRNSAVTASNTTIAATEYLYDHTFTNQFYKGTSNGVLTYTDETRWNGINARMNPCPPGWRVATTGEFTSLGFNNLNDGLNSALNLGPTSGRGGDGTLIAIAEGRYWTTTLRNIYRITTSNDQISAGNDLAAGYAIRCVTPTATAQRQLSTDAVDGETFEWLGLNYTVIEDNAGGTTRLWLDRNLGATVAPTSATDATAGAIGWQFQWGRRIDGHQVTTSGTTATQATNMVTTGNQYITDGNNSNTTTWHTSGATFNGNVGTANFRMWNGVNGINNPCPPGWEVPLGAVWTDVTTAYTTPANLYTALNMQRVGHRQTSGAIVAAATNRTIYAVGGNDGRPGAGAGANRNVQTNYAFTDPNSNSSGLNSVWGAGLGHAVRCVRIP